GGLSQGSWRAFYDPKQDLYVGGYGRINALSRFQPAKATLTINCRNTLPIATHASLLSGFDLSQVLSVDGPDVEINYYSESPDQFRNIQSTIKAILFNKIPAEEIIILVLHRRSLDLLKKNLALARPVMELNSPSQPTGTIAIATIASFKGL